MNIKPPLKDVLSLSSNLWNNLESSRPSTKTSSHVKRILSASNLLSTSLRWITSTLELSETTSTTKFTNSMRRLLNVSTNRISTERSSGKWTKTGITSAEKLNGSKRWSRLKLKSFPGGSSDGKLKPNPTYPKWLGSVCLLEELLRTTYILLARMMILMRMLLLSSMSFLFS